MYPRVTRQTIGVGAYSGIVFASPVRGLRASSKGETRQANPYDAEDGANTKQARAAVRHAAATRAFLFIRLHAISCGGRDEMVVECEDDGLGAAGCAQLGANAARVEFYRCRCDDQPLGDCLVG